MYVNKKLIKHTIKCKSCVDQLTRKNVLFYRFMRSKNFVLKNVRGECVSDLPHSGKLGYNKSVF